MRKEVLIVILFTSFIATVSAGSIGISPAYYIEHFEPNLEKTYSFRASSANEDGGISVVLEGNLAEYGNLSKTNLSLNERFTVTLKLPENLSRPGEHNLYVRIFEARESEIQGGVGGLASIRAPVRILVPYPGKYAQSKLKVNDINENEESHYSLEISNLGTEDIVIDSKIQVFKITDKNAPILTKTLDKMTLESKKIINIEGELKTQNFEPGEYFAIATISYGKTDFVNTTFRVGEFLVDILDYDYLFERGKINQFDILIGNKWNTIIESVFADVTITDNGDIVSTFRTVSVDTKPWEVKNVTGFLDTEKLESKRYLANINLKYGESETYKLVAIYVEDPPVERSYLKYALIGIALISLISIIVFILLILKIKKLKGEVKGDEKGPRIP